MLPVWPMTESPASRTIWKNRSRSTEVRKPGIDSSLSIVPPVCPSPRPLILATGAPHAATTGATISVVLSPTPPVLCLSTLIPGIAERSTMSPDRAMQSVSTAVSCSSMPLNQIAISRAEAW